MMNITQFRLVVLLACVAVIRAASTGITVDAPTNVTVDLLQTKRYSIIAEKQYTFYIPIASASQKGLAAVVFQIHAQRHTIVLSQDPLPQYGRYANGSHVGLYQDLLMNTTTLHFYATAACLGQCSELPEKVQVMIAATVVKSMNPIPGGCTLVSPLDVDPNLALSYTQFTTKLIFQPSNIGYDPVNGQIDPTQPSCIARRTEQVINAKSINYKLYRRFLSWRGTSENDMFSAIEAMLTADNLTKSNNPSVSVDANTLKQIIFDSFIGEGVVYSVVATDSLVSSHSTAYVPSVTYACDINVDGSLECGPSLANMIVGPLVGLIGLFLVYLAHRLFHVEVIVFTFLIASFNGYILVSTFVDASFAVRVGAAAGSGVLLLVPLFIWWFFTGWYLMFVFFFTAAGGFLLAATIMYTPFGMFSVWKISYVYGLFIACVVVFLLIPAVLAPRILNIVSSSFVGGYLVIYAVGAFVYTSLPEIVLRVAKNIYVPGYLQSDSSYPFELNDIILVCVWAFLLVSGIIVQLLLARKRDSFPKSLYKQWQERFNGKQDDLHDPRDTRRRRWRRRLHSYASSRDHSSERARLLY